MSEKKLLIISTGGTIGQIRDTATGASVGVGASDGEKFAELLRPELSQYGFTVDAKNILSKDSSNVVPEDWVKMIDTIVENYDNYDSFLITHGTNTMGYTAAALSFALGSLGKRVVLTGSQVPFGASGSDALLNLQNAACVAMTDARTLVGVMAVFGSKIMSGTRVKKHTEFDYDGFKSFGTTKDIGYVGRIVKFDDEGLANHMDLYKHRAKTADQLDISKEFNPSVLCITEVPGLSSEMLITMVKEAKVQGLVFRAVGAGDPNIAPEHEEATYPHLRGFFDHLKTSGIPIVVTTQSPSGVASMDANPSGILAQKLGAIPAWDMSIEAMYVKLSWLLGRNVRYEHMRGQMLLPVRGEINTANV